MTILILFLLQQLLIVIDHRIDPYYYCFFWWTALYNYCVMDLDVFSGVWLILSLFLSLSLSPLLLSSTFSPSLPLSLLPFLFSSLSFLSTPSHSIGFYDDCLTDIYFATSKSPLWRNGAISISIERFLDILKRQYFVLTKLWKRSREREREREINDENDWVEF